MTALRPRNGIPGERVYCEQTTAFNVQAASPPSRMKLYDISIPLTEHVAVWPGDVPFSLRQVQSITGGDSVNLSSITLSVHAGTHLDAPLHISAAGDASEALDLSVCIGRARLMDVSGKAEITCADLSALRAAPTERLILRTGGWTDHSTFPREVPTLAEDVPDYLRACGVKLLGLDVPSVDRLASKALPLHNRLIDCGITILESLDLAEPPEGIYDLIVLPLRIPGSDGAPARAVLKGLER